MGEALKVVSNHWRDIISKTSTHSPIDVLKLIKSDEEPTEILNEIDKELLGSFKMYRENVKNESMAPTEKQKKI
ncbi:hypothetical protein [Microbulbifer epialgicus]|uniref:Uncharacterized protein n=1 Tax=Microbulbifer epialgicus TaxID=393907 RepID=A0ABV4P6Q2_9GAMM